jgi:general transcription factor 3C polypeptide 4
MRVIVQSSLPGAPPALVSDAQTLARSLPFLASDPAELSAQASELCPACQSEVKLEDPVHGVCLNGHVWREEFPIQR